MSMGGRNHSGSRLTVGWSQVQAVQISAKFFRLAELRKLKQCEQVAAVCYRVRAGVIEFLLVQTGKGRWIFPKGSVEPGLTHAQAAALEAFEEAGVLGAVAKRPVGSFSYQKRLKSGAVVLCDVHVFPLEVRRQSKQWPEKQERVIKWLSASQAAEKVGEPMLSEIIRRLARKYNGRH